METNDYIDSGILELYVYGILSEDENREIDDLARKTPQVENEILEIENAILQLSSSFSPFLSPENFLKIKERIGLRHSGVIPIQRSQTNVWMGWAASILLLIAGGYSYMEWKGAEDRAVAVESDKNKLQETVVDMEIRNKQTETVLNVMRDPFNKQVALAGQAAAPSALAKIFYNQKNGAVYIDASGLPEPPKGKVYQVWALKMNPLTPTSIGLLDHFSSDNLRMFAMDTASGAEAFGVTLEPAGGSKSPTMAQLYTMGLVNS